MDIRCIVGGQLMIVDLKQRLKFTVFLNPSLLITLVNNFLLFECCLDFYN